ncbi:hypothetical protein [Pseudofrankia sp. BMG5.37]|uniref:hypothetical protein n=1 Tax=Pseudofrankia sp. BMG5.37 TaxID=3050035 RepID=UPI002894F917|nr:hypothetical protein [Pseudofrankia sp. BMG5.37]MDT3446315.1 hypothetical protein [Pseudofrankia sp. BMG5.37]
MQSLDQITIRAELSRLRRPVGADIVASRPYRLTIPLDTDVARAWRLLRAGDLESAVELCAGALLPGSAAPGVAHVRELLREEMNLALLRRGDPRLLMNWAASPLGRDDLELWQACRQLLPDGPDHDRVTARINVLDRELS